MIKPIKSTVSGKFGGFTLVELAIVLVIISLLVAGIMAGEEVLETSKRMAVISTLGKQKAAYDQFVEKYYAAPGDMPDAESVWGASNTDNGDGDGDVEGGASDEEYLFWQHMGLSGFIDGRYPGSLTGTNVDPGVDIPSGPYTKSGYSALSRGFRVSSDIISISLARARSVDNIDYAVFTPKQAHSIDRKVDDGNPSEGQIVSEPGYDTSGYFADSTCITAGGAGDEDDVYALSETEKRCYIIYYMEFAEGAE